MLEEIPRVRNDFGEPPLVTPSSQIVGTQAVLNVLMGQRYKMFTKESKKLLMGEFGQTVKPFNPEVQKKTIGNEKPITCRPADLLEPQLKKLESEMSQWKTPGRGRIILRPVPAGSQGVLRVQRGPENRRRPQNRRQNQQSIPRLIKNGVLLKTNRPPVRVDVRAVLFGKPAWKTLCFRAFGIVVE